MALVFCCIWQNSFLQCIVIIFNFAVYNKSKSVWRENPRWKDEFEYIIFLSSSFPSCFLFAEDRLEMLLGKRNAAKAIPGQLLLVLAKWKIPWRSSPLVIPLGKLFHCCTTLLVNNIFLKSKLNLPSCILGLLPLIVPSASSRGMRFCHLCNSH